MVEERAVVVSIERTGVWVETQRQSACGRCAARKGCGNAVLQKVFGNKRNIVKAVGDLSVKVGDHVVVGLDENAFVKGSMLVYALPILLIIILSVLGETIVADLLSMDSEVTSILGAVVGLVVSYFWLNKFGTVVEDDPRYQPVLLRHEINEEIRDSTQQSEYNLLG